MADASEPTPSTEDEIQVDLLSAETSTETIESAVRSARNWPAIGLMSLTVVALSVWLLSSVISKPTPAGQEAPENSAEIDENESPASATTKQPTTTTPSSNAKPRRELDPIEPIDPGSSLSLIFSVSGRLRVIDFATGQIVGLDQLGDPMLVVDDYLLLRTNEKMQALPLNNLGGSDAIDLPIGAWDSIAPSGRANEVWGHEMTSDRIAGPGPGQGQGQGPIVLVDLTTGEVRKRLDPLDPAGQRYRNSNGWPDLITGSGGVYERVGDGFRQRTDGSLHAADDQLALVETCDAVYRCELTWLDRSTWEPVDERAVPDDSLSLYSELTGGGKILLYVNDPEFASVGLLDITTGDSLQLPPSFDGLAVAVGPEGLWVAFSAWEESSLTVQTIDGGRLVSVPNFRTDGSIVITELP